MSDIPDVMQKIMNMPIAFGLRAQGHMTTISKMLADGESWQEIGDAIGWDPETARLYYEKELKK